MKTNKEHERRREKFNDLCEEQNDKHILSKKEAKGISFKARCNFIQGLKK